MGGGVIPGSGGGGCFMEKMCLKKNVTKYRSHHFNNGAITKVIKALFKS